MKMLFVAIFLMLAGIPGLLIPSYARTAFEYRERTGDKSVTFTWRLERVNGYRVLISHKAGFTDTYLIGDDGGMLQWKRSNPTEQTEFTASKNGREITLAGTLKGEAVNKTVESKEVLWFQHIAYCLSGFARSNRPGISFFVLRPDDLKPFVMKAARSGEEVLKGSGGERRAWKLRVSLAGLLSRFWHGFYWYDRNEGHFLRYEGVNGPPGTPETVISLE